MSINKHWTDMTKKELTEVHKIEIDNNFRLRMRVDKQEAEIKELEHSLRFFLQCYLFHMRKKYRLSE